MWPFTKKPTLPRAKTLAEEKQEAALVTYTAKIDAMFNSTMVDINKAVERGEFEITVHPAVGQNFTHIEFGFLNRIAERGFKVARSMVATESHEKAWAIIRWL